MAQITSRRTIASLVTRAFFNTSSSSSSSFTPRPRLFALAILNNNNQSQLDSVRIPIRFKTSGSGYSPLNDPSPNWSNRPPKETILLDGCDYEHWLIVMEFADNSKPSEEEMINSYVKTLASVIGSEEEAKKKIYSVCTTTYTGFGALMSEELSYKVKGLPGVLWVLPDSYLDVPNKDYGGICLSMEKSSIGPQYRFNERQQTRNRPRPRHDRRPETMQVERRQPMPNQNFTPASNQNSASTTNQNSAQGGESFPMNQGDFSQRNA